MGEINMAKVILDKTYDGCDMRDLRDYYKQVIGGMPTAEHVASSEVGHRGGSSLKEVYHISKPGHMEFGATVLCDVNSYSSDGPGTNVKITAFGYSDIKGIEKLVLNAIEKIKAISSIEA